QRERSLRNDQNEDARKRRRDANRWADHRGPWTEKIVTRVAPLIRPSATFSPHAGRRRSRMTAVRKPSPARGEKALPTDRGSRALAPRQRGEGGRRPGEGCSRLRS